MTAYDYLGWGSTSYAEGAKKSTAGKPLNDNNFDKISPQSSRNIRKQTHWLNVNSTDIPAILEAARKVTIGVSVNVQVESPNENFNNQAEEFLKEFHQIEVGELTNKHHGNSAFRAMSDFDLLDGGFMVRHHYSTAWEIPYKYELVPVDMIDVSRGAGRKNDMDFTLNGLVYNKWNQITHIWLYETDDKMISTKVSIKDITYYSEVWASLGQQTAISKLASILPKLDQIDQYAKAELDSAIEAAKSGAFLKSSAYNEIMLALRDQISKVSPTGKQNKLDTAIDFAKPILDRLSSIGIKPYGLTPIPSDDEVSFDTRKRDGVFDSLNNNSEMKMGAAMGMTGTTVYGKVDTANYSAIKWAGEDGKLLGGIRFDNLSNKVIDDINRRAIEVAVQIGRIKDRIAYWKNPKAFHKFRYLRQIHIDIEPAKNATANKTNLEIGIKTEKQIIEERDGRPYEDFLKEKEDIEKKKIMQKLNLEKFEKEQREKLGLKDDTELLEKEQENKELKAKIESTKISSLMQYENKEKTQRILENIKQRLVM